MTETAPPYRVREYRRILMEGQVARIPTIVDVFAKKIFKFEFIPGKVSVKGSKKKHPVFRAPYAWNTVSKYREMKDEQTGLEGGILER